MEKNTYQKEMVSRCHIAIIGNYLPRQCGIATFTTDLCEALATEYRETQITALAVNDTRGRLRYPDLVQFELTENDLESYRRAALFLKNSNVDLICLQHEYDIFGGHTGSYILVLLRELQMPIVTTLHTVLRKPRPEYRSVLLELAHLSVRLIVMSEYAAEFLQETYSIPKEKINKIPHGIPDLPFVDPNLYKDQFGAEGKIVLLTFGLLRPKKGIEHVISALPAILDRYPDVIYFVIGTTSPRFMQSEGETYRLKLEKLAHELRIEQNIVFHNQFVSQEQLNEFVKAADLCITPYANLEQTSSGVLACTVGAGKVAISTPYWYAQELLANGHGVLVPFNDSAAIADQVIRLLDDETSHRAIRERAYMLGREMTWPRVACQYMDVFQQVLVSQAHGSG